MGDAPAKAGRGSKLFVDVQAVVVTRATGKQHDVSLGDGFGEGGPHAQMQVFDVIAAHVVHCCILVRLDRPFVFISHHPERDGPRRPLVPLSQSACIAASPSSAIRSFRTLCAVSELCVGEGQGGGGAVQDGVAQRAGFGQHMQGVMMGGDALGGQELRIGA